MATMVNSIIMAVAILIAMVFAVYVVSIQSDKNICVGINSLTEATAADLASALKYVSFSASNQAVKRFNFPDRFQMNLNDKIINVKYTGSCLDEAEYTINHNVKRIKTAAIEDSKNKRRTAICVKKYIENCEPFVTLCLASDPGCCELKSSDCGGYSTGEGFNILYENKLEWVATKDNIYDDTDKEYLIKDYSCSDGTYYIKNVQPVNENPIGFGLNLSIFKLGGTGKLNKDQDLFLKNTITEIDSKISIKITDISVDIADNTKWSVSGEIVCGKY